MDKSSASRRIVHPLADEGSVIEVGGDHWPLHGRINRAIAPLVDEFGSAREPERIVEIGYGDDLGLPKAGSSDAAAEKDDGWTTRMG